MPRPRRAAVGRCRLRIRVPVIFPTAAHPFIWIARRSLHILMRRRFNKAINFNNPASARVELVFAE